VPESEIKLKLSKGSERPKYITAHGDMTLHELSYLCKDLFNTDPSKEHSFSVPEDIYNKLQDSAINCSIFNYETNLMDQCWDDDYDGTISLKSWYKGKYTKRNPYYAASSSYLSEVSTLEAKDPKNILIERLPLKSVFTNTAIDYEDYITDLRKRLIWSDGIIKELKHSGTYDVLVECLSQLTEYRKAMLAVSFDLYDKERNPGAKQYYLNYYQEKIDKICKDCYEYIDYVQPEVMPFTNEIAFSAGTDKILISLSGYSPNAYTKQP